MGRSISSLVMRSAAIAAWVLWVTPDPIWKRRHEIGVALVALATLAGLALTQYPHCAAWCAR